MTYELHPHEIDEINSLPEGMTTNYEAAVVAERKRVVRNFQPYTSEQRATHAASHRISHVRVGEFFYTHPDVPGVCFATRRAAALAALHE